MANLQILIAGASGYIGKALIAKILQRYSSAQICALSRSQQKSEDPRVSWRACDLFSLRSIEEAAPNEIDVAFYLVHSMGPTAHLDQGTFADYDLILADNFARAMKKKKAKHVIYLGGLIPTTAELSLHLKSRLEVEEVFREHKLVTTIFRAGLILGESGSSFQILLKLVKRLPIMICPAWTQTKTTPVDLETVLMALTTVMKDKIHFNRIYDLAGCQPLTYIEMMRETARRLKLKRYFLTVPFFTPTLSRLWVSLITNTSKDLVYPLIESLEHEMVARPSNQLSSDWQSKNYFDLLDKATMKTVSGGSLFRFRIRRNTVRSVQRMALPKGRDAKFVKDEYFVWLKKFASPFIQIRTEGTKTKLNLFFGLCTLLELDYSADRSTNDRVLLYITNGILVSKHNRGRFEFRMVLENQYILAAIHDFRPAIPWFIYVLTQAPLHLFVMQSFAMHLARQINTETQTS